ncbi:MAG: hypothetical protein JWN98_2550, partial [Abditibacteriota bacterium]|nr:hypothetical protein [Abditibacteriota bacterium]
KGKLNYSNEVTLHQRLEDIFDTYTAIFGVYQNQDAFIKRAKDTRNYLTHYDAKSKRKAAQHEELYRLSQSVRMLLEMCLLKELGLADDTIRKILQRGREQHWFHLYPLAGG